MDLDKMEAEAHEALIQLDREPETISPEEQAAAAWAEEALELIGEVRDLRRALTCGTCHGEGFVGYPDQQEPCPGCIDVRRKLPGGRWFGVS